MTKDKKGKPTTDEIVDEQVNLILSNPAMLQMLHEGGTTKNTLTIIFKGFAKSLLDKLQVK